MFVGYILYVKNFKIGVEEKKMYHHKVVKLQNFSQNSENHFYTDKSSR